MPPADDLTEILPPFRYTPPVAQRHPVKAALTICAIVALLAAAGAWVAVCAAVIWAAWG